MKIRGLCLTLLLATAMPALSGQASDSDDELVKKIKSLGEQIETLRAQQSELTNELSKLANEKSLREARKLADEQRRLHEEVERKLHVAKVSIRGKLVALPNNHCGIEINELTWKLDLGNSLELVDFAKKHLNRSVVVTGTVVNVKTNNAQAILPCTWDAKFVPFMQGQIPPAAMPVCPLTLPQATQTEPITVSVESMTLPQK